MRRQSAAGVVYLPEPPVRPTAIKAAGIAEQPRKLETAQGPSPLLLPLALGLGLSLRLFFVVISDFPLHDGGLFYQMIADLRSNGYVLPYTTTYNQDAIPFVYPPAGLYLGAFLSSLGLATLTVLQFLPFVVSALVAIAFLRLANTLIPSAVAAVYASLAFVLMPESTQWLIVGGGLTRSLGALFAILFLALLYRFYTRPSAKHVPLLIALGALSVVSHFEWAYFAVYSGAVFFALFGRHRAGALGSAVVCLGVFLATMPWWLTIAIRHGLTPFFNVATGSAGEWPFLSGLLRLGTLRWTEEPWFPLFGGLALFGVITCLKRREFFLPVWLLAVAIMESRGIDQRLVVPAALLAGLGIAALLEGMNREAAPRTLSPQHVAAPSRLSQWLLLGVALYGVAATIAASFNLLVPLSAGERAAMAWARENTPDSSRFVVVDGDYWVVDRSQEWFPTLTRRVSLITVQGYEPVAAEFGARVDANIDLRACSNYGTACLEEWRERHGQFSHVYVPRRPNTIPKTDLQRRDCCGAIREALFSDPKYEAIYDGPGATIFVRKDSAP